jgi:putative methionine-R-sulfoxide reductase with GAF domain
MSVPQGFATPQLASTDHRRDDGRPLQVFRIYQLLADTSSKSWDDVIDLFLHRLGEILQFEGCLVYIYDRESDELVCECAHGRGVLGLRGRRVGLGVGLTGWVAAHRRAQLNSSGALDANDHSAAQLAMFSSALVVPICHGDSLLGVISLYRSDSDGFSKTHEELLTGLGRHLAPLIKTKRFVGIKAASTTAQFLTGSDLDKYLRQVQRGGIAPTFVLVVVKLVSGHALQMSTEDAQYLYRLLREGDLLFVCDANTVVCWLADADGDSAKAVQNRLAAALGARLESATQFSSTQGLPSSLAALLSHHDRLQPVAHRRH